MTEEMNIPSTSTGKGPSTLNGPVLAFDSALGGCVVGVIDGATGQALAVRSLETAREQAALLVPMVRECLEEAGVAFADLALLVTTHGPGSFTGLRIGLSAARSFVLALDLPAQGVGTLDALMHSCCDTAGALPPHQRRVCLIESKRQDFYVRFYDAEGRAEGDAFCALADDIRGAINPAETILCGDAVTRFLAETESTNQGDGGAFAATLPRTMLDPVTLCRLGAQSFGTCVQKVSGLDPVYLRGADVSYSKKKQREIADFPL